MTTAIFVNENVYYTKESIRAVLQALDVNETIAVWWFSPTGQRYREDAWFDKESVWMIRTESDDG